MTVGCGWVLVVDEVDGAKTHTALANMLSTTKIANTAITICILRCERCLARFAILITSYFISDAIIP
jgi:hypothetical protein